MIKKKYLKDGLEDLRELYGTLDELKEVKSQVIKGYGSIDNWIDTIQESFRIYIEELKRYNK